jgi:Xaa-Pro aminopeptidase
MSQANSREQLRREKAVSALAEFGVEAFLVTSLHNVRYLTGFTGSNAMLLVQAHAEAILYTDPRYTVQSKQQVTCEIRIAKGPLTKAVVRDVGRSRVRKVGFEQDHLSVAQFESLRRQFPERSELLPLSGVVEKLRMVKDASEIALIRASVEVNSGALEAALKRLKAGMTEAEFAAEIDYQSRKLGAEGPAFDTIVAAGERAALPHAHPGAAKIGPGMLLIDMGAFREGYASDMTRMVHLGLAKPKYKKAYKAVLEAQLAAIAVVKPGARSSAVDAAARRVLKRHGLDREFIHSTGHGLGLEIHEPPRLGRKDKTVLEPGMAITIEPGVYIEGWGGIRIEDTVLVTGQGCEILTPTGKELREL